MAVAVARAGCLPIEATCAEEGWILALSGAVDLVMVSQSLPNMSGAELIGLLRGSQDERLRQVPVIGLARHELCEHSLASVGVTCFVRSPYCEADVMRAIRWVAEVYWTDTDADASRSNA
jgi:CheY-like chemotaxis protein